MSSCHVYILILKEFIIYLRDYLYVILVHDCLHSYI